MVYQPILRSENNGRRHTSNRRKQKLLARKVNSFWLFLAIGPSGHSPWNFLLRGENGEKYRSIFPFTSVQSSGSRITKHPACSGALSSLTWTRKHLHIKSGWKMSEACLALRIYPGSNVTQSACNFHVTCGQLQKFAAVPTSTIAIAMLCGIGNGHPRSIISIHSEHSKIVDAMTILWPLYDLPCFATSSTDLGFS